MKIVYIIQLSWLFIISIPLGAFCYTPFQGQIIPILPVFIKLCGFDPNSLQEISYTNVFPKKWGSALGLLEDKNPNLSTQHELGIAILVDPDTVLKSSIGMTLLNSLSFEHKGLHTMFLLRELARIYPKKRGFYLEQIASANVMFELDADSIENYFQEMTRYYLVGAAINNQYFVLNTTVGKKTVIHPDIKTILDYLLSPDWKNKKAVIQMMRRVCLEYQMKPENHIIQKKFAEFESLVSLYPDLTVFKVEMMESLYHEKVETKRIAANDRAQAIALETWTLLRQYSYEANDIKQLPYDTDAKRSLDEDDFALYLYVKLSKNKIPVKILEIDYSGVLAYPLCVFLSGSNWMAVDQHKGLLPFLHRDVSALPALFFRRNVYYREVDVENYWLKGLDDRVVSVYDEDVPADNILWQSSIYPKQREY